MSRAFLEILHPVALMMENYCIDLPHNSNICFALQ